ncbi:preprotein translocase subunit SecA [Candidatus Phytoplasma oryzae]|uniref:Protein translocase subunit SecA n=1 Tax=Candidatus Phytoplasma oryzae TaxID=203274 RepID=A0A328IHM2_9MOLU|nr:preprotein translocase subunit SecA [Candidatus Phytoplasma oryzae]RAM57742.1 preprotein translocase subunit SecA [Candidatus Phytoplasma oryzae]
MFLFLKKFFNSSNNYLKKIKKTADKIEQLSEEYKNLKDEHFPQKTEKLKKLLQEGRSLDSLLIESFALAKEASRRVTGLNPYYVQILGAIVLHQGQIAEMKTGEGKTLTSVMPAYLNSLSGKGVHIVTVNEYLAQREAQGSIGEIFRFLGVTVGLNIKNKSIEEKQKAYSCDILYTTNSEIGFDFLRDNIETNENNLLMKKEYNYAIIDEVDSVLIDEARTPLIISDYAKKGQKFYMDANRFAKILKTHHYIIDLETNTIELTEEGIKKGESFFRISNFYNSNNIVLLHCIKNALKAHYIMSKNKDYLVSKNNILIIDEFTGRILEGRQFSDGLHQALEAKEGCIIKEETEIAATITYQNFFRIYKKISGMTGTAKTEEKEFKDIYKMKVIEIPTNKLMIRRDEADFVFATITEKWTALIQDVEQRHEKGQPILIGTTNVEVSEQISKILKKKRIRHEILNAKNHFKEAEIIFKAGEKGAITIATNMAGRGTDIRLGQGVKELGGLAVLGTERHESRRIDNQLRGRAGRQGDPGFSRFFVSGEDDLVKRFGGNKIQKLIIFLNKSKEDKKNISSKIFTNFFTNLQKKIESSNFEQRKFVLQFDSVLGLQREIIYKQRRNVLTSSNIESLALILINKTLDGQIENFLNSTINKQKEQYLKKIIDYLENLFFTKQTFILEDFEKIKNFSYSLFKEKIKEIVRDKVKYIFDKRKEKLTLDKQNYYFGILKNIILHNIDNHFKNHIYDMSILRKSINFVSYGQQNSLVIYQNEGQILFNKMIENIALDITSIILKSYLLNNQLHESFIEENHQTLFKFSRLDKQKQNSKKYKKVSYKKKPWD